MAQIEANGATIVFQQSGEGPDVVLLHGLAANRAFWFSSHVQPLIDAGYRVTVFDLRGHGYSAATPSGYSAPAMVSDLTALMDALNIRQAHLVGHSYGGGVALEFAVEHPQRVPSLVLMDSKINRLQPQQRLHEGPALTAFENAVLDATPGDWENETQIGLRYLETLARMTVDGDAMPATSGWTPFGAGPGGKRTAKQFVRLLDKTEARREFTVMGATPARIQQQLAGMAVCLIYGSFSRCLPSQAALKQLVPQAICESVPEAGHFFPATHVAQTAEILSRWFAPASATEKRAQHGGAS